MKRVAKHVTTGVALLVAAAMVLALVGTAVAKPIKIRFSHVVSPNTPKGQAADMFAKLANERLKGKVEVQVFPNSQLYTDKKVLDALSTGSVEMAAPSTAKFTSWVPQLQLFDLPFLFKNSDALYQTIDGKVGQKLFRMLGKKNMLGLAMWDNGFKQIGNNKHEIKKPSDAGVSSTVSCPLRYWKPSLRQLAVIHWLCPSQRFIQPWSRVLLTVRRTPGPICTPRNSMKYKNT